MNTSNTAFSQTYFIFLIVFLGMLSGFGPFVTDMYLPTLPAMAQIFHASPSLVQTGLATSMLGLSVGQVFFGPLSDKYGRRPILIAAMLIFGLSTIGCIFSPDIYFFNGFRFLQGLGGSGGIVLSRSIATDSFRGRDLIRTLAIIGAIHSVAPVASPIIGGLVAGSIGWQGIFWILFAIGMALFFMCWVFRESLDEESRHHGSIAGLLKNFPILAANRSFLLYVLIFASASGVLFSYISSASFIIQKVYGYSDLAFSLVFAINSLAISTGAPMATRFRKMDNAALLGATGISCAAILQGITHWMFGSFACYEIFTFIMLFFLGFIFTSTTALAMEAGRQRAGTASAFFGASGFLFGALVTPLVGMGNIMASTAIVTCACALAALGLAIFSKKRSAN